MTLRQIRSNLPRIAPLLAAAFVFAQVLLTAHVAAFGPDKHLHGSEPCSIALMAKAQAACDVVAPVALVLPDNYHVIESLPVLALVPAEQIAPASRGPPALS